MTRLEPGIYFDCVRGHHIHALVVALARQEGWEPDYEDYPDYEKALSILQTDGVEGLEHYVEAVDPNMMQWLEDDATEFLRTLTPEGHWCGYHQDFGDWGVYETEEEDGL